jgi:hypothetical protein
MNIPFLSAEDVALIDEGVYQAIEESFKNNQKEDIFGRPFQLISPISGNRFVMTTGCADHFKKNKLINYRIYTVVEVDENVYLDNFIH